MRTVKGRGMRLRSLMVLGALVLSVAACNQRGPDPTEQSVRVNGPFAYTRIVLPNSGPTNAFGGGQLYYPIANPNVENGGVGKRFGAVAMAPGWLEKSTDQLSWYGPLLASNGFIVIMIDTKNVFSNEATRATELQAALDYLTSSNSPVAGIVAPNRLAVMGFSMGGGGALRTGVARPGLKAVVALSPNDAQKSFPNLYVPTLMVSCQNDTTSRPSQHAIPMYNSIPNQTVDVSENPAFPGDTAPVAGTKARVEFAGLQHDCPVGRTQGGANTPVEPGSTRAQLIARSVIPWLKHYVDDDWRYDPWICPAPAASQFTEWSAYESNCGTADRPGPYIP